MNQIVKIDTSYIPLSFYIGDSTEFDYLFLWTWTVNAITVNDTFFSFLTRILMVVQSIFLFLPGLIHQYAPDGGSQSIMDIPDSLFNPFTVSQFWILGWAQFTAAMYYLCAGILIDKDWLWVMVIPQIISLAMLFLPS